MVSTLEMKKRINQIDSVLAKSSGLERFIDDEKDLGNFKDALDSLEGFKQVYQSRIEIAQAKSQIINEQDQQIAYFADKHFKGDCEKARELDTSQGHKKLFFKNLRNTLRMGVLSILSAPFSRKESREYYELYASCASLIKPLFNKYGQIQGKENADREFQKTNMEILSRYEKAEAKLYDIVISQAYTPKSAELIVERPEIMSFILLESLNKKYKCFD